MSTLTATTQVGRELSSICGAEHVVEGPAERIGGLVPTVAVTPGSVDEVAAIVRFANEHGLCVIPAGGFTQQRAGNRPARVGVLLYTSRLTEIEHYDAADLTIGLGAGWTVASLSAKLATDNLFFPGDPALPERCTVGGLLATGLYGPLRQGYGGLRDYCIGIRFVTGDGRKAKGGGRVVKNVAGYDMMKLLIGSWGTLGIITSASFKLFPAPRQTRTFVAAFANAADAVKYRDFVLRSPLDPICLELVSPEAVSTLSAFGSDGPWLVLLRAAGSDAVLARYRAQLGSSVSREVEGEAQRGLWLAVQDFCYTVEVQHPDSLLLSLTLPLRNVQAALDDVATIAGSNGLTSASVGRIGTGHLLTALWPPTPDEKTTGKLASSMSALRDRLPRDASMAVLRCPPGACQQSAAWTLTPTHIESMRVVKNVLDPNDILNRGRFAF